MYALLTALSLLVLPSDLSNHWRWSSASVNQSEATPIPPDIKPIPNPSPNPVPVPPTPTPTPVLNLKPGDDCPKCNGGYIPSDGSAKVKCWQCEGDGIVNEGDPILTNLSDISPLITPEIKDGKQSNIDKTTEKTQEENATPPTKTDLANESNQDKPEQNRPNTEGEERDQTRVCYKPQYSPERYWILDPEANKWVRSAKQPPITKQVETGHWETQTYTVCNGRKGCKTYTKRVWVSDGFKNVTSQPAPRTSYYPVRGSWWTGCRNWTHLTKGQHAGKFDSAYLQKLSWEELQSLHSDNHEGRTKWQYVNK